MAREAGEAGEDVGVEVEERHLESVRADEVVHRVVSIMSGG